MRIVLYFERKQEPLGNNQLSQLVLSMKNELNQNFITQYIKLFHRGLDKGQNKN